MMRASKYTGIIWQRFLLLKIRGREEGLKEGIEKGLKEGRKEGILSVARNLRSGGMSVEAIAAATGLSIEEIEQLD
mgnify:CR=1 FL=1